ncbi:MAG: hydroxypyruvate isomerase [Rhodospirillaceae bacterium]|nr:hydroxypyruvate isomerase [Rhodospirillaceae bacterium]
MPRFAANVSMLFTEVPLRERFALAAKCGFAGAECQFPYEIPAGEFGDVVAMSNKPLVLFNAPPGDYAAGERGLAALKGRESEFKDSLHTVLQYAEYTECKQVHVMSGVVAEDEQLAAIDVLVKNLEYAAKTLSPEGIRVLIENINIENYMTRTPTQAAEVVRTVGHKNLKLQYDIFHAQTLEGGITAFIENNIDIIGHIQVAGVPNRDEPDSLGELNWGYLFDLLDAHGYDGWIGAEYTPRHGTMEGLQWGRDWGISAPVKSTARPRYKTNSGKTKKGAGA